MDLQVPLQVAFAGKIPGANGASVGSLICVAASYVDKQVFLSLVAFRTVCMFTHVQLSVLVVFKRFFICKRLSAAPALEIKTRSLAVGQGVGLEIRFPFEALVAKLAGKVSYLNLENWLKF
jgi:hypothetical protein